MGEDADVRRPLNRNRLVTSLLLALGLVIIVFSAAMARTGGDEQDLPEGIEAITPDPGSAVQRQSDLLIDLAPGYDGIVLIEGQEIPADQVSFDEGRNLLLFPCRPVLDGAPVANDSGAISPRPPQPPCVRNDPNAELFELPRGTVRATVEYWRIVDGREAGSKLYFWSFRTT